MATNEKVFSDFMNRFNRKEDIENPFAIAMKMLVASEISNNGIKNALLILNDYVKAENICIFNEKGNMITSNKPCDYIIRTYLKKYISDSEDKNINKEFRNSKLLPPKSILFTVQTEKNFHYIAIFDMDLKGEEKEDIIEICQVTFYAIFTRYELIRALNMKSQYDALTGVKNRLAYQEYTTFLSKNANDITFIVSDLFSLKRINDDYGHLAGDHYIKSAAKCLEAKFPNCVYRTGGDEFAIIISDDIDVEAAFEEVNVELAKCMHKYLKNGVYDNFFVNYGYISGNTANMACNEFYRIADSNLSQNKRALYQSLQIERRRV